MSFILVDHTKIISGKVQNSKQLKNGNSKT